MKRSVVGMVLVVSMGALLFGLQTDVSGTWQLTTKSERGERTNAVEFVQTGETLKVISETRDGEKVESEGTLSGNSIAWSITRETQRGTFTLSYKGEVSGATMKGTVQYGTMGSGEWTAQKQ